VHAFRLLNLTRPSPVENLVLDDALLDENAGDPVLRFLERDRTGWVTLKLPSLLLRRSHEEARFAEPCHEETSGFVKSE